MWFFIILFLLIAGFSIIYLLGVWSNIRSGSSEIVSIWTQLKEACYKRCDLVSNLVNSCKIFLSTEPVVIENLLASSKKLEEAVQCDDRVNVELSENLLRKSFLDLNKSVKKIPKLKANKAYDQSVKAMDVLGEDITKLIQRYNSLVTTHNDYISKFPGSLFIPYFPKYGAMKLFKLDNKKPNKQKKDNNREPAAGRVEAS